jgi:hypothetical protein
MLGRIINVSKILVGQPEGRKPFGRSGRRWENRPNIQMDLKRLS